MEHCTLIEVFTDEKLDKTKDAKYNQIVHVCHYGALVMEFVDSWDLGNGECDFC